MSFNVAMLEQMREEGLGFDACIRVLKAAERKSDPTNAQRQARFRENKKAKSNAVTVTGVTPPNDIDILTPPDIENSEPKGSSQKFVLPPDIPAEPWAGWLDSRKRLRKSPTEHAKALAVAELRRLRDEEGWPPGEVLDHCTMNSYQGIFPPSKRAKDDRTAPTVTAVNRILGDLRNGGPAGQDSDAGGANVDDRGAARALAPRRN